MNFRFRERIGTNQSWERGLVEHCLILVAEGTRWLSDNYFCSGWGLTISGYLEGNKLSLEVLLLLGSKMIFRTKLISVPSTLKGMRQEDRHSLSESSCRDKQVTEAEWGWRWQPPSAFLGCGTTWRIGAFITKAASECLSALTCAFEHSSILKELKRARMWLHLRHRAIPLSRKYPSQV